MTLNILAVTSEAFPLAKTGGLGDAVSGLAKSLGACGARVTVLLPAYPTAMRFLRNVHEVAVLDGLPGGRARLLGGDCPDLGLQVLLLQNDALYDRAGLYMAPDGREYDDNAIRFAALAHAAARVAQGLGQVPRPDVVHIHDWHAALVPLLMRQLGIKDVKSVITLHNIAFQGVFPMSLSRTLGIEDQYCTGDGIEFWGKLNFLKAGIRYADLITAVSHHYAREILTPQFGCGLEGLLASRARDLLAIPNGIDTVLWNPQDDAYLPGRDFSAGHLQNKALCKSDLQRAFGLETRPDATVMAMGSRLTTQKMIDVAIQAIPLALDAHPSLQACVIGEGDNDLESALQDVAGRYKGRCSVHIGFEESQAHLLHAGADILLHGSRFEPFGLTPLYSMRYGTIPLGSRVGGMVDTIKDSGSGLPAQSMRAATGILFEGEHASDMKHAIDRAMALRALPDIWHAMQMNAMGADLSWEKAAPAYARAYKALRPDVAFNPAFVRNHPARPVRQAVADVSAAAWQNSATEKEARLRRLRKSKGLSVGAIFSHSPTTVS